MLFRVCVVLSVVTGTVLAKPLCDSLEDYFKNSTQPGSKRLRKTITRICTAFDVVKYDGVDPFELFLPPVDEEEAGTAAKEEDEMDFIPDGMALNYGYPGAVAPWPFHSGFPIPFPPPQGPLMGQQGFGMDQQRQEEGRNANKQVEAWPEDIEEDARNTTSLVEPEQPQLSEADVTTTSPMETASDVQNSQAATIPSSGSPSNATEGTDDDDDEDDGEPILNDLADFVASVRFLSLNDTRFVNIIMPEKHEASRLVPAAMPRSTFRHPMGEASRAHALMPDIVHQATLPRRPIPVQRVNVGSRTRILSAPNTIAMQQRPKVPPQLKNVEMSPLITLKPSLAIDAPNELLPPHYVRPAKSNGDKSGLPEVYRIYSEFSCEKQRFLPGVYSDTHTQCKVFHLCLPKGYGFKSASFICPRHLRYSQEKLRCEWAPNVDCSKAGSYYSNNQFFSRNYVEYLKSLQTILRGNPEPNPDSYELYDYVVDEDEQQVGGNDVNIATEASHTEAENKKSDSSSS